MKTNCTIMRLNTVGDQKQVFAGKNVLQECTPFSFIGRLFETDSIANAEFEARLKKAYAKLSQLTYVRRKNKLLARLKRRLIQTLVFPMCTYGYEAWNLSRDSFDKLASFGMIDYRRMLRVSYTTHITNAGILNRVGLRQPTQVAHYQGRKLCYFGHVTRHEWT